MVKTPTTTFGFVEEWFKKYADNAHKMEKSDSAALWRDGLEHLQYYHKKVEDLTCCGNCIRAANKEYKCHRVLCWTEDEYCDQWKFDGKTREDRKGRDERY